MLHPKQQTYNDGICGIYSVGNAARPGFRPKDGLALKIGNLRYENRTVGATRFYAAKAAQERVDILIRTPRRKEIYTDDVAILEDGRQFKIKQVQQPIGINPPSTDLSPESIRTEDVYDII